MKIIEKSKRIVPAFLCGFLSILFVQTTATAEETVSREMVLKHVVGQTWFGETLAGWPYITQVKKDGTLDIDITNYGAGSSGSWSRCPRIFVPNVRCRLGADAHAPNTLISYLGLSGTQNLGNKAT